MTPTPKSCRREPLDAWVLDYRFDKDEGDKVTDASGKANHGHTANVALAEGREGRKARRFEGLGCIEVPKSPSLNPAVPNWTVEVMALSLPAPKAMVVAGGNGHVIAWRRFVRRLVNRLCRAVFKIIAGVEEVQLSFHDLWFCCFHSIHDRIEWLSNYHR